MKKILINCTYFLPNISGLTIYVARLRRRSLANNFDVRVITSKHNLSTNHKHVTRIGGIPLGKFFFMPFFSIVSLKHVFHCDVLNCHLPSTESIWLVLWAKLFNKKIVTTYHCFFETRSFLVNTVARWIDSLVLGFSDKIIVNSFDYAKRIRIYKRYKNKMVQIYPPIELGQVEKSEYNKIKKLIDRQPGENIIGFLGRLSSEKKVEVLLNSIPKLNNRIRKYKIILAGNIDAIGESKYRKKIMDQIKNKRIIHVGQVERQINFFKNIDCLVLTSTSKLESFGMVSAEAMIAGVPVITTNIGGIRIPVRATRLGQTFKPDDCNDLAKKIEKVLSTKYDEKLFDKAKQIFSIENFTREYIKCLE